MNDYGRIEQVIRHLDAHHRQQPSLEELAATVGLSATHFHRLFRRWAGVTPKDFLQCLTAEFARRRLRESQSVLAAALEAGLSGPGRLHDLLVTLEAASPGEIRTGGQGLTIGWGFAESRFGPCSLGWTARGICHLAFDGSAGAAREPEGLAADWPAARRLRDDHAAQDRLERFFAATPGPRRELRAYVRGTSFQVKVWRALLRIQPGCVATYGWVARAIGVPAAARAVGSACGANPVALLIPCHRVIRETGIVEGYHWGSERKKALLAWEATRGLQPAVE